MLRCLPLYKLLPLVYQIEGTLITRFMSFINKYGFM